MPDLPTAVALSRGSMVVRHVWLVSILVVLFCPCLTAQASGGAISVFEAKIAVYLFPETRVEVPVFNDAHRAFLASIVVEMLGDESNKVIARHERHFEARSGRHNVVLDWASNELPTKMVNSLSAYRLRYRLASRRKDDFQSVQGIIQMGPHMVDGFGIQGYPSGEFPCALDCSFLVRVTEPNTGRALAGYDVTAKFGSDDGVGVTPAEEEWRRIAGIQKEDLLHLDPAKPIPDGMDLVAWALLGAPKSWIGWSWGYYGFRHEQFDNQNLAALKPALQKICEQNTPHPTTNGDVLRQLKEAGVDFAALRDGWEMPYRLTFVSGGISIVSNGADKTPNNKDDYVAEKCQWP